MSGVLPLFDTFVALLRAALFWVAAGLGVVLALDWLVRTRRLSPFGWIARAVRTTVDPALRPIERRVVRAGGLPSSAPWWALGTVVIGGILLVLGV